MNGKSQSTIEAVISVYEYQISLHSPKISACIINDHLPRGSFPGTRGNFSLLDRNYLMPLRGNASRVILFNDKSPIKIAMDFNRIVSPDEVGRWAKIQNNLFQRRVERVGRFGLRGGINITLVSAQTGGQTIFFSASDTALVQSAATPYHCPKPDGNFTLHDGLTR